MDRDGFTTMGKKFRREGDREGNKAIEGVDKEMLEGCPFATQCPPGTTIECQSV